VTHTHPGGVSQSESVTDRPGCLRGLLRSAAAHAKSKGLDFRVAEIGPLPLFNADLASAPPSSVLAFRSAVGAANGFLFATPEHSGSYSAALKNALDWADAPLPAPLWKNKAAAVVSVGGGGGVRAQLALRASAPSLQLTFVNAPEVAVRTDDDCFNTSGELISSKWGEQIAEVVDRLVKLAQAMRVANAPAPAAKYV